MNAELARVIACLKRSLSGAPSVQQVASQFSTHTNAFSKPADGYEELVGSWIAGTKQPDHEEEDALRRAADVLEGIPPRQHGT